MYSILIIIINLLISVPYTSEFKSTIILGLCVNLNFFSCKHSCNTKIITKVETNSLFTFLESLIFIIRLDQIISV